MSRTLDERFTPSRLFSSALEAAAAPVHVHHRPVHHQADPSVLHHGIGTDPGSPAEEEPTLTPRRALVLGLAGITAATEAAAVAGFLPDLHMADLKVSIALLPALVLAVACGPRLLGRATLRRAAVAYWCLALPALPLLGYELWRIGHLGWFPGLLGAALGEELVYRLAIPAVIAAALRIGRVRPDIARVTGLVVAGLLFVSLPGHVEQMTGPAGAAPFLAFAALSAVIVYRSGSILPMAIGHAISNLVTVLFLQGVISSSQRGLAVGLTLAVLVLAYGRSNRITLGDDGELVDTRTGLVVTAIDLRDGQPASVELADGRILPVHTDLVVPADVDVRSTDPIPDPVPADLAAISDAARARRHRLVREESAQDVLDRDGAGPTEVPVDAVAEAVRASVDGAITSATAADEEAEIVVTGLEAVDLSATPEATVADVGDEAVEAVDPDGPAPDTAAAITEPTTAATGAPIPRLPRTGPYVVPEEPNPN